MEAYSYTQNSYLDLLLVACGFLILQYLQIVLIARYGFSESEEDKPEADDSFPPERRRFSFHHSVRNEFPSSDASTRRHSFSFSPALGSASYAKRRGRRTFGIKHL